MTAHLSDMIAGVDLNNRPKRLSNTYLLISKWQVKSVQILQIISSRYEYLPRFITPKLCNFGRCFFLPSIHTIRVKLDGVGRFE